jgi:MYXO-CTERM domain-containing protein
MARASRLVLSLAGPLLAAGCATEVDEFSTGSRSLPLAAYCTADVQGKGIKDVETDYLPRGITCENGGASLEALKAQAISARSYLYYKLETSGSIVDGQGDQVYTCGAQPQAKHFQAVQETAGQVLRYNNQTVAAFYVAGSKQSPPACKGVNDVATEKYVTYNEGLSGDNLTQTTLGWVNPKNYRNRGCMSQWGSRCLETAGYDHLKILRFYYGEDIGMLTAEGSCITPPGGQGGAGQGGSGASGQTGSGGAGGSDGGTGGGGGSDAGSGGASAAGTDGGAGSGAGAAGDGGTNGGDGGTNGSAGDGAAGDGGASSGVAGAAGAGIGGSGAAGDGGGVAGAGASPAPAGAGAEAGGGKGPGGVSELQVDLGETSQEQEGCAMGPTGREPGAWLLLLAAGWQARARRRKKGP